MPKLHQLIGIFIFAIGGILLIHVAGWFIWIAVVSMILGYVLISLNE